MQQLGAGLRAEREEVRVPRGEVRCEGGEVREVWGQRGGGEGWVEVGEVREERGLRLGEEWGQLGCSKAGELVFGCLSG